MGWRILQISKPCKLSVKNRRLVYEPFEEASLTIPLEDISVVILENRQILLSNSLLSELPEYDIVLFTCDFSHLPSGVLFPFHTHSRYSQIAWLQRDISEPLKKRLWQEVIKAKINNQAAALEILNKSNAGKLREIAKLVQSGDTKNSEAFTAAMMTISAMPHSITVMRCCAAAWPEASSARDCCLVSAFTMPTSSISLIW